MRLEEDYDDEWVSSQGRSSGPNKRRRLEGEVEEESEEELEYDGKANEVPELQEIVLEGQLLMIFKRDKDEPENISGINMALKGAWNMG